MRIKNLNIGAFGKLEGVNIGLDEKITVIYGRNEAGKSSIATFIKYMLYGFDSSKKAEISENQKKKYMPWESGECSGEMTFSSQDGKLYTAMRKTAARNQNTVFDENNMPVTSDNAGDYFFGINENAYKKTAFIGQNEAMFTDDGELDSALKNMVFSADESVDSQKALKKLEDIRKYYLGKAGRSGQIYELEKELCELRELRDKWKDGHKELLSSEYQLSEIQKKIAFNKERKEALERERANLECFEAKCRLLQIDKAKQKASDDEIALSEHQKLMQRGDFAPDTEFVSLIKSATESITRQEKNVRECEANFQKAKKSFEEICADETQKKVFDALAAQNFTAEQLLSTIKLLKAKKKKAKIFAIILTCLIVTIPIAIFFYISASKTSKQLEFLCEKYGCRSIDELEDKLTGESSFKAAIENARSYLEDARQKLENSENTLEEYRAALGALAEKGGFDAQNADEYILRAAEWLDRCAELVAACREDSAAYKALLSSVNIEELTELASRLDESIEIRDMKTVTQQLTFYTQANDALIVKERELEKQAAVLSNTLPKPSEIQSRILSLEAKLCEMKEKHSSLTLALETLERASENMRSEASPKIAAETSELFSKITGGKYKALYADNEMKLAFLEKDSAQVRDAGYLSAGTLDAAYISLRLALCEFLYKEHPTLVFDDAFANMDNERLGNTLDFLVELSQDFQIVILSCHDREKEYLSGRAKIINFEV